MIADSLIGLSYFTISATLAYLVQKGRRDIPFHWLFLAFGLFIVACGGTHLMEVVTVWVPVYVVSASLKVVTASVSVATAVLLPFTVPQILSLIQTAKASEAAKEALRQNEAGAQARADELAVILDAVPGMTLIAQDPACRKITGNRVAYELLRLPYGVNISKSAPDGEKPSTFRMIRGRGEIPASELPIQKAASTGEAVRESEITLLFDDGTSRDLFGNAVPLLDHEGAVRGAVGVFVDITDRNRAEIAHRESENRYRDLVENSQDLLCTHDLAGNLLSCNPAPARILGYEVADLLKIPMREVVAPEYRE